MEFISYLSVLFVTYLGLGAGIALALIAEEEINPGKKYLSILQNILLLAIVFITIYFLEFPWLSWIILMGLVFFIPFVNKQRKKSFFIYIFLSIMFWVSSQPKTVFPISFLFPLIASLIFLIGFPTGSLLIDMKKKNIFPIMISNIHFILIGLVLYFV